MPKTRDGKFRLMLVGDIHESFDYSGIELKKHLDCIDLISAAADRLKPDLTVFMGDVANADTENKLRTVIENSVEPLVKRRMEYAVIFGNHDGESGEPQSVHASIYRNMPYCLFQNDARFIGENFDYALPIEDEDGNIRFMLWMINSGSGGADESYYALVSQPQIDWFEKTCGETRVPGFVFQHIPVCEEYELTKNTNALSMVLYDGVRGVNGTEGNYYRLDRSKATGYMGEAPATPDLNSGQFDAWKRTGLVKAAFFGHDHMNDFVGEVDGITLAQCKLSGFRPYGDGMRQGVRIVDLDFGEKPTFTTKMVYYRELVGNKCRSIHGRNKYIPDRWNVKIDVLEKALIPAAALAGGCFAMRKLIKK